MFKKLTRNPFFLFLPFLFYYGYVIVHNKLPTLYGDEVRYFEFAQHLLNGYYSPPMPYINLWNGPGYPLLLTPFVALGIPALYIILMNAVYLYLTIVFLYKALSLLASRKIALVLCLLLAIYPSALAILPILYTEAVTYLLVSAFIYTVSLFYVKGKTKYAVIAGLVLGYLILTKVIFGYVVVICLGTCLVGLLFRKYKSSYLRSVKILAIPFAVSVPYLCYTYSLTGKFFYWGNSGGMSLYWMSTPYEHEYGDWKNPNLLNRQYPALFKAKEVAKLLHDNHVKDIMYVLKEKPIEQDALYKQMAIANIKKHPMKFFQNYCNNVSRMLFNFPYSYSFQDANIGRNIIIGSSIMWATVLGIIMTLINWRRITFPIKLVLLVTGVYLALSGALSAYPRQLDVVIPVLLFWIGFLMANMQKLSLRFIEEENLDEIELTELTEMGMIMEDSGRV
ncbi:MAG: glycosyltransferase family 39 protein [Mucilaginibacter sp.]|uniref:ArnT family glycosyltransferase n=1 Tax=Mucilaginibacter sp. TaxID=1882438 RepID=UPI0032647835